MWKKNLYFGEKLQNVINEFTELETKLKESKINIILKSE